MYRLNRKSFERLKALVRAGTFVDRAFRFTPADSNTLLGDDNWTEYQLWFLGIEIGKPDSTAENGANPTPDKSWYAYPFGKGDAANLEALEQVVRQAKAAGEGDIADAAAAVLEQAAQKTADQGKASGAACDRNITWASTTKVKIAAAVGSKKKLPTFEADAYTGGPMDLEGWTHPVVIDYDGINTSDKSRPVLRDHDPSLALGHTTDIHVGGEPPILKASGVISGAGKHVDDVVDAAKNDFPWQVSVGAKVIKNQFVPEGSTAEANGRTWPGPINIARATLLREISILTLGADDDTSARIAAAAAEGGTVPAVLKKKFAAWMKSHGFKASEMDDGALSSMKAAFKSAMKCEADDKDDEDDDGKDDDKTKSAAKALQIQAAVVAAAATTVQDNPAQTLVKELRAAALGERTRLTAVSATLEEYRGKVDAEKFAPIEAKAIGGEWGQEKVELELIKAARPTVNAPMINTGKGGAAGSPNEGSIIAAAMCRSYGVGEKAAYAGLDERSANLASSIMGLTIHQIIAMSSARLGIHCQAGAITDDFLNDFLRADKDSHRMQIRAAKNTGVGGTIRASAGAGFSTMSLTGITENILYKSMLQSYSLQESVVPEICFERDTNDFKPFKVYRLTAAGNFQPLGPGGELKLMSLQDESYANQVKTQGVLLVLKREDIINDDMGALMQAPQTIGEEAAQSRESTVLATFLSGTSTVAPGASVGKAANSFNFFSAGAKNYLSGGSSALSISSMTTAVQKFQEQKNANGRPIGIPPQKLLVAPANRVGAEALFNGAMLTVQALAIPAATSGTSAAQTGSQVPNYQAHKGMYKPVVSPYLSAQYIGNDTQWGLLANPAGGKATVQVGYLRGQRTPIIRQVETDAIVLGLAYQAIYDFGVALLDYRTGVYSAGQ